jgi:hypothetical protein
MFLGCLGMFRCRARSLGRSVVVVWHPAHGRLASCPEPCVGACLCLLGCACGVFFVLGHLPFFLLRVFEKKGNP